MVKEMKIPSPGESITEVEIASWLVENGEYVDVDQPIAEIDSDKATLELVAEFAGAITLIAEEGDAIEVGSVVCSIDTSIKGTSKTKTETKPVEKEEGVAEKTKEEAPKVEAKIDAKATPVAREMIKESGVKASSIKGSGANGRITKGDVEAYVSGGIDATFAMQGWGGTRDESEKKMSMLRRKVAQRLVAVKQETAMLTTFNEIDMSFVMDLRKKHKEAFREKHGVNLGFMSFFTKACTEALRLFPSVNGMIDGDQVITYDYADIGIAVSSPKGLMVPVVRNAEQMSLAEIEAEIKRLAIKARDGKLAIDEMTGGTFTITNGGVFGSMMSTPIINPPQSAILGMHNIVERPIAVNGEVVIRPIMYIALSYDHRIIDGKESVSFLYQVKEMIENPLKLMFGSKSPEEVLLGL
jgi:2-oxoglutarate dehydrogenase E2 component (dihydrolipoamide succinyltransferase)